MGSSAQVSVKQSWPKLRDFFREAVANMKMMRGWRKMPKSSTMPHVCQIHRWQFCELQYSTVGLTLHSALWTNHLPVNTRNDDIINNENVKKALDDHKNTCNWRLKTVKNSFTLFYVFQKLPSHLLYTKAWVATEKQLINYYQLYFYGSFPREESIWPCSPKLVLNH